MGGSTGRGSLADINVTPLVDVMLVLLIIFMVTAPMIHHGVKVAPPADPAAASSIPLATDEKLVLNYDRAGTIRLGTKVVALADLFSVLKNHPEIKRTKELHLNADPDCSYGDVARIIATARRAGVEKLGMVIDLATFK